jgi:hypothetical protein
VAVKEVITLEDEVAVNDTATAAGPPQSSPEMAAPAAGEVMVVTGGGGGGGGASLALTGTVETRMAAQQASHSLSEMPRTMLGEFMPRRFSRLWTNS